LEIVMANGGCQNAAVIDRGASALLHAQPAENTSHRRAVEAVIWVMPVVSYDQAAVRELHRTLAGGN
jgi:hypothetical protein